MQSNWHTQDRSENCLVCGKVFGTIELLMVKKIGLDPILIQNVFKNFNYFPFIQFKIYLKRHIRRHGKILHSIESYSKTCDICDKTFHSLKAIRVNYSNECKAAGVKGVLGVDTTTDDGFS